MAIGLINIVKEDEAYCCGNLEIMNIHWMHLEDGSACMPYLFDKQGNEMYRVNNCPSCGKYVRDVIIKPKKCTKWGLS